MAEGSASQDVVDMTTSANTIQEINTAQCDVSRYLQMAYISTKNQPDIAAKIRLTAHLARTQRVESSALIRRFAQNASHVQKTLIPMILEGVDMQIPSIITGGLEQALSLAAGMETETEKAREKCQAIQTQVQEHIGQIDIKEKDIRDKIAKMKIDEEHAKASAEQAKERLEAQKKDLERIQKEGKEKRKERKGLKAQYDKTVDANLNQDNEKLLDGALFPNVKIPEVQVAAQVTAGLVNLVGVSISAYRKHVAVNQAANQLNKADDQLRENAHLERENEMAQFKTKKERLQQLCEFKKLCLEAETTGDVSGLVSAAERLGHVDELLRQLIDFWNTIVLCIICLISDTSAGRVYIDAIENEKVQQKFLKAIEKAKKGWCEFERICRWYHNVCARDSTKSNKQLYDFLSKPIENMGPEEIKAKLLELEQSVEADIWADRMGEAAAP